MFIAVGVLLYGATAPYINVPIIYCLLIAILLVLVGLINIFYLRSYLKLISYLLIFIYFSKYSKQTYYIPSNIFVLMSWLIFVIKNISKNK